MKQPFQQSKDVKRQRIDLHTSCVLWKLPQIHSVFKYCGTLIQRNTLVQSIISTLKGCRLFFDINLLKFATESTFPIPLYASTVLFRTTAWKGTNKKKNKPRWKYMYVRKNICSLFLSVSVHTFWLLVFLSLLCFSYDSGVFMTFY